MNIFARKRKGVGKEMKIGLLNGGLLGILALVLLGIYVHAFKGYVWAGAFAVSGCVGISLVLAMMVSSMVEPLYRCSFIR